MRQTTKISTPKYSLIATDIAAKIVDGNYKVGDKIYARSSIASQYNVSSETARRAICVLSDLGIVETTKGSGVIIKSYSAAVKLVHQNQNVQTLKDIKQELMESVTRQTEEMNVFLGCLNKLLDKTERFRTSNPLIPFQADITKSTPYLDKSISEINFWQNTFATIVAIRRGEELQISPGPYAIFREGDTVFFIGDEASHDRVYAYLYPQEKDAVL